ncbi:MAG: alpha/beta fold hydrolase [Clostridiales bacterium]|nr:alpha/beta fold hydrolase [Clostridiales bacterium]
MQNKLSRRTFLKGSAAGVLGLSLLGSGAGTNVSLGAEATEETLGTGNLVIAEQGIFSAGGTVITSDGTFDVDNYYTSREGSTSHVDHANVYYQIPAEQSGLPMVFLHGYGQSRMGWMTTPDGRQGWSDMFLRMGHSVWLIDQPRRGEAGQTSVAGTITTEPSDQTWYTQFRIGTYLEGAFTYNEGSQFPEGEEVLDQFFRQMTPDTGMDSANGDQNIDNTVVASAVAASIDEIYERTGQDSILVTHSQGGAPGWETALYTDHIAAIIAIEPGAAATVDTDEYNALLEKGIPVTFYYGDYIGEEYTDVPAAAMWAYMASTADTFTEAYNAAGGNSTVVRLPDEGITGNSHFMFQELNNDVIAEHVETWIQENVI